MQIETQIQARFDNIERETINRALAHIRIAYPDYDKRSENRDDGDAIVCRALNRTIQNGEALDVGTVRDALGGLDALAHACAEQADLPYWRDQMKLDREEHRGIKAVAGTGGIPLVGNPEDFCRMLAETREWQLEEVDAAREVLREAKRALIG